MSTSELQHFRRGWFTIEAVQLTRENINAVFEWADSKPFIDPDQTVSGLTIFESTGRNKANFGDWIYKTPGGDFRAREDAEFRRLFLPTPDQEA